MIEDGVLNAWFEREVFPLERTLMSYIRRNSPAAADLTDVRQEIYERVFMAAREEIPQYPKAYIIRIARNYLIDRARRARIVSFELVADLDDVNREVDMFATERQLNARDELRRTLEAVSQLPPRCREVVRLRKVEGLSTKEVAERMGISVVTVEKQTLMGMRAIANLLSGEPGRPGRLPAVSTFLRRRQR